MKKELLFTFSALIATTSCNIKKTDSEQIAGKKPMNIIYIMSDDHSYQTISAYDKRFIQTPNIDRLANEGVRFTNSFVANSISGPSRACILTGKHSHANGFTDNSSTFDGSQQTYPKLLQKAGYETAIIGKWHLTSAPTGFDYSEILIGQGIYYNAPFIKNGKQVPSKGYVTNVITEKAIDWMENIRLSACYSITKLLIVHGCPILVIYNFSAIRHSSYQPIFMTTTTVVKPLMSKR